MIDRLEEIKENLRTEAYDTYDPIAPSVYGDLDWLIAEVELLRNEVRRLHQTSDERKTG